MRVRGFEKHEELSRAATVASEFNKLFQGLDVDLSHHSRVHHSLFVTNDNSSVKSVFKQFL